MNWQKGFKRITWALSIILGVLLFLPIGQWVEDFSGSYIIPFLFAPSGFLIPWITYWVTFWIIRGFRDVDGKQKEQHEKNA